MMETEDHKDLERDAAVLLGDHYEGFEDARRIHQMMVHFETIKDLTRYVGDDIVQQTFKIKPCVRTLRYVGREDCQEPVDYFVKGCLYQSIDFNGATYTISGYCNCKSRIGSAYFEWVLG